MELKNPFSFKELRLDAPFCNRHQEVKELVSYAQGQANVILYSPRRYGKTSLVRRVQSELRSKGFLILFSDFFGITSVDEIAMRTTKALYEVCRSKKTLFEKSIQIFKSIRPVLKPDEAGNLSLTVELAAQKPSGMDLLEETLSSLLKFSKTIDYKLHFAFDEFQEIVELKDSIQIEGIMRANIQRHPFSYFFIGSRRRILLEMFNSRKRPFFQSAINYELKELPLEELTDFISNLFNQAGKKCPNSMAEMIAEKVAQHPYYTQKFSFFVFEISGNIVRQEDLGKAYEVLIESEKPVFEAILQGLTPRQIALLSAIAIEPSSSIFSLEYMKKHQLSSMGGTQGAQKRLNLLDLIEKDNDGVWKVVDPVFRHWLIHLYE